MFEVFWFYANLSFISVFMTMAYVIGLSVNSLDVRAVLPPLLRLDFSLIVATVEKLISFCDVTKCPDHSFLLNS